VQQVPSI